MTKSPPRKYRSTGLLARCVPPVLLILLGVAGFAAMSRLRKAPEQGQTTSLAPLVEVVGIRSYEDPIEITADGEVVPFREVTLSAEVPGRISEKTARCRAGRAVSKGDVLIRIDARDYELEIQQLQEQIRQSEVGLEELEIDRAFVASLLDFAEQELALQHNEITRLETLRGRSITTAATLEAAQRNELQARNNLQRQRNAQNLLRTRRSRLEREVGRLTAELGRANLALERTTIRASVDGIVVEDQVEENEYVQLGTPLVRLLDTTRLEVEFQLQQDEVTWLREIDPAQSHSKANPFSLPQVPVDIVLPLGGANHIWSGHLSRYDGARIDPTTRTIPCIATVPAPDTSRVEGSRGSSRMPVPPTLMQGMFVTLRLRITEHRPLLEVPYTSLKTTGNNYQLCTYDNGKLRFRDVELAYRTDDRALIDVLPDGPRAGEMAIKVPPPNAIDRMSVRVPESSPQTVTRPADGEAEPS